MAAASSTDAPKTGTLLLTGSDDGEIVSRRWRFTVEDGPDRGQTVVRDSGTVIVGTHPDADLVLTDASVSRYHLELKLLPEGVLATDLGSTNGTRVGGVRIERCFLPPASIVKLGHTKVRLDPDDKPLPAPDAGAHGLGGFVTSAPELARTLGQLARVSATEATVLIQGETGTGKEVLARAIHQSSQRASAPFVVVDCGAVQQNLLESHLFGYIKGAFTGAATDRIGAFEAAAGGTVFLDELGELPLELQPKLLRVLESRTIRRLGDVTDRPIDARFVAATNRDLEEMVRAGGFRSDLYYRVAVVRVRVPPLRDRPSDVTLLSRRYLDEMSGGRRRFSLAAMTLLENYDWPGNARELRNVVQRAIALSEGEELTPDDLFPASPKEDKDPFHQAKERVIETFENRYVRALLARHNGNVSSAAREAGLSRNALYSLMKRAGL